MFDVNAQWSEMKKWTHMLDRATSIVFCAALSEYDEVSLEGNGKVCEWRSSSLDSCSPMFSLIGLMMGSTSGGMLIVAPR